MTRDDSYVMEEAIPKETIEEKQDPYAGFWMRFWAYILDVIVVSSVSGVLLSSLSLMNDGEPMMLAVWTVRGIAAACIYYLYFILMTKFLGQTLGKMVLGLRVIQENNQPLTWLDVIFREGIGRLIYNLVFGLKFLYLIVAFTSEKQGIHDMIGHTRVVHERR